MSLSQTDLVWANSGDSHLIEAPDFFKSLLCGDVGAEASRRIRLGAFHDLFPSVPPARSDPD